MTTKFIHHIPFEGIRILDYRYPNAVVCGSLEEFLDGVSRQQIVVINSHYMLEEQAMLDDHEFLVELNLDNDGDEYLIEEIQKSTKELEE